MKIQIKRPGGSFLQLDGGNLVWTEKEWEAELRSMKKLGMDTVIIGTVENNNYSFYRSEKRPLFEKTGTDDPLATLLSLAQKLDMKVFVGLCAWDWKRMNEGDFEEFARRCLTVADELWGRYGTSRAFAGWYALSWEMGNAPAEQDAGVQMYLKAISHLRKLSPGLPIMTAPYFTLDVTPQVFEDSWRKLLPVLKVDIVALQDGVGCGRNLTPKNIGPYFEGMQRACHSAGVHLWADVEVFDIPSGWKPAPTERIVQQMEAVSPHVERIVFFEYNHYLSPVKGFKDGEELTETLARLP
ncbi:MAG: DUF4434 domain-containing protein [Verrucomicrobia bacterium]|nr:DUF4434 domain-containing protein [Verrucomicrobiota bacterium]MCG2680859.1 DUF4434 domain-containing protein [Kiritimatiellia bacterium]MBU4246869.1 DUF4434 domain-containing protein [Verrucomicrobiota bacterium]MBU4290385.1 DUF4434 domain-containing protein [Verrucomicrobiota bacterium]MBU4430236.1 DUF4434 domain-containing protein [Verrucomicrobiota bacterium]